MRKTFLPKRLFALLLATLALCGMLAVGASAAGYYATAAPDGTITSGAISLAAPPTNCYTHLDGPEGLVFSSDGKLIKVPAGRAGTNVSYTMTYYYNNCPVQGYTHCVYVNYVKAPTLFDKICDWFADLWNWLTHDLIGGFIRFIRGLF
ncbi:MAG: hypothetical protein LBR73_00165 [Oscillospiraceae bacterium]|jgi:hypothetical protein|nr:hypothetical protein [Oscillospiraceae bacterium]